MSSIGALIRSMKLSRFRSKLLLGYRALPMVKVELLSLLLALRSPSIIEMLLLRVLVTGVLPPGTYLYPLPY